MTSSAKYVYLISLNYDAKSEALRFIQWFMQQRRLKFANFAHYGAELDKKHFMPKRFQYFSLWFSKYYVKDDFFVQKEERILKLHSFRLCFFNEGGNFACWLQQIRFERYLAFCQPNNVGHGSVHTIIFFWNGKNVFVLDTYIAKHSLWL